MRRNIRGGITLPTSATKKSYTIESLPDSFANGRYALSLSEGDRVRIGDPIGAIGELPILSPFSGTVRSDGTALFVHEDTDEDSDRPDDSTPLRSFGAPEGKGVLDLTAAELIEAVREAAIPCYETREPLAAKLSRAEGAVYLIAVAAFDTQPYVYTSSVLATSEADKLVNGLKILMSVFGVGMGRILISARGKEEKELHRAIGDFSGKIRIQKIIPAYPAHRERPVYSLLTGRELSYKRTPEEAGVLILSPAEAVAIGNLFLSNLPFTRTAVCVDGPLIGDPGCLWVPVGTRISDLLEQCFADKSGVLIENGLMDGRPVERDSYVTPYTHSLTLTEPVKTTAPTECIGCNRCFRVCPMYLSPKRILSADSDPDAPLGRIINAYRSDPRQKRNSLGCIGCGCCSYVCPARLPLRDRMQDLKAEILGNTVGKEDNNHE